MGHRCNRSLIHRMHEGLPQSKRKKAQSSRKMGTGYEHVIHKIGSTNSQYPCKKMTSLTSLRGIQRQIVVREFHVQLSYWLKSKLDNTKCW